MVRSLTDRCFFAVLAVGAAATLTAACAKDPPHATGSAGAGGSIPVGGSGGGTGGSGGSTPVSTCSDAQAWTPPPAPGACADAAPTTPSGAVEVTLAVDAGTSTRAWNRFYEKAVASDHAHTFLCTSYGRNIQNALRKAHAQIGFQYVRFHGVFNDDMGVYSEDASGAAVYNWASVDVAYDAIIAAGMRPMVEVSFTPSALASDATKVQTLLWYNNKSPNISPPTGAGGDWGKWQALMTAFVHHLEERYGADEVRNNWYFEVWNEPSWMYSLGDDGYFDLYKNTVTGLLAADAGLRVGGPAGSAGESQGLIQKLIAGALNTGTKLDFLTYHRYGDDNGLPIADTTDAIAFHKVLVDTVNAMVVKGMTFQGELMNNEFGPSWMPSVSRDTEVAASYIAKMIHRLGTDPAVAAPAAYGYWAVSDLYEEINTGSSTAFRQGNYGLMMKGDPAIPESFDVAKPSFNAYRLLHMMSDQGLGVTGGMVGDGVGAAATRTTDGSAVQVLVYNHFDGGTADASKSNVVSLTLNNLPFTGAIRVRQYIVDYSHANAYRVWMGMGSPVRPTQAQWVALRNAAELCYYETTAQATGGSWMLKFAQNVYGVDLFEIRAAN